MCSGKKFRLTVMIWVIVMVSASFKVLAQGYFTDTKILQTTFKVSANQREIMEAYVEEEVE